MNDEWLEILTFGGFCLKVSKLPPVYRGEMEFRFYEPDGSFVGVMALEPAYLERLHEWIGNELTKDKCRHGGE